MSDPIRVFVGCAPDGLDAESQAVVEHSLKSRSSRPVEITWMRLSRDPASPFYSDRGRGWLTDNWVTPFSAFRYAIPELCGFEGRAIYCDSDVMFLDDVAKLNDTPIPKGKGFAAKTSKRLCVTCFDCAAMRPHLPPIAEMQRAGGSVHVKRARELLWAPFRKGENWNCIDGEGLPAGDPSIKCVHFSDIATQPQLALAAKRLAAEGRSHWFDGRPAPHPRPDLVAAFRQELQDALVAGYTLDRYDQSPRYGTIRKRPLPNYQGGPRMRAGEAA